MKRLIIVSVLLLSGIIKCYSQLDSIIFNNGNIMVGEIKSMDRNILKIKTDYSDEDFMIEWDGIGEIYTETYFLITLTDGSRHNGKIKSDNPGKVEIHTDDGKALEIKLNDIVILDDIDQGFWSQIYASVDFGYDITKANNLRQFSLRSNIGYIARRWQLDVNFSSLSSKQDNVENVKRTDGGITYKYFLPHDWYPMISLDYLSNTEQQLDLRSTAKLGMGKYVIHTNKLYWGFSLGTNRNVENYSLPETPDRNSWEGFLGRSSIFLILAI